MLQHETNYQRMGRERERHAETNQWHMIVCIYCRRDSCRSHVEHTIVCDSRCVYVFQLWDVRSKFRCRRCCFVMYSIMSLLVARYHLETHYFVLFVALVVLVCPFFSQVLQMYWCVIWSVYSFEFYFMCKEKLLPDIFALVLLFHTLYILFWTNIWFLSWVCRCQPVFSWIFIYALNLLG